MMKRYLSCFYLFISICFYAKTTYAQYAVGGTAGPALYNAVYWLTWDKSAQNSTLISVPAGADRDHIINGTYVWQSSPSVRITATLSNEVFINGDKMIAYTPGNYVGDGLDLIYSGNNLPKPASRGVANSGLATINAETVSFDIDLKVSILINGVYVMVNYPGMILADAESLDADNEFISGSAPNSIAWQLLNKRNAGDANDTHYKLQLTDSGRSFKLFVDQPPGDVGVQAVLFAKGATSLTNVTMKGFGLTAIAIGLVFPFDFGDAPASYGGPAHYIDDFETQDYFTADGTYTVIDYNISPLIPKATVYIGTSNVDADGQPKFSINANADDTTANNDENSFNPDTLASVRVNRTGDIILSVPVTNTKQVPATLYAWLDINGDGSFEPNEATSLTIPQNTNNQSVNLIFKGTSFGNLLKEGPFYARLRITTSVLADDAATSVDERSINYAADGEVEDYRLKDILGSGTGISGRVFDDGNGALDNMISGSPLSSVSGKQLFAYLTDSTSAIIDKIPVDTSGYYHFDNVIRGNYTVIISVNDAAKGEAQTAVPDNLPPMWVPSADGYGVNNGTRSGIEPGTPNLAVVVTMPGNGVGVSDVNFGIDKRPVTVADKDTTTIGQPVTIAVLNNDSDADGNINPGTVLLTDPADGTKKTIISVTNQGVYQANTQNGQVTFTPTQAFTGKATPVQYTVKDNYGAESLAALISITVKPKGVADTATTSINTPVAVTVKANDGASGTGTTVIAGNGTNGTTVTGPTGIVTYTPATGFTGTDMYTYTLTTADSVTSDPIKVTIRVTADSTLSLTKIALNTGSKAGDIINYRLVVKNNGNITLSNVMVKDDRADAGSISPANIATLTVGASATITARHTLTQIEINSGNFANQASVTGTNPVGGLITQPKSDDPSTQAPNDSTRVIIAAAPAISIVKTGVLSANKIDYTFIINNTGNVTLRNITLTDSKLSFIGIVIPIPQGGLQPGSSVTYVASYTVLQADKASGSVINNATATGTGPSGIPVNSSATATTPVSRLPVAVNDIAITDADKPVVIAILSNDDAAGSAFNPASVEITTSPQNGTVSRNTDGTVVYSPNKGFSGQDIFYYRVKDLFGYLTNIATVTVTVNFTGFVNIPNLFTPNGDGRNDVFEIRGLDQYAANNLVIVNRWGNEVYKQDNYQNNWLGDGLNEGTYFYVLHVKKTAADNWQIFKGYVTLLRVVNR